ncbi:Exostosin-2 [Escovopsis weberi]|uniref:Exostosin-2 n=1 Tax=Escovopsis weberi TaxID=150374 RepID=A0A0M8N7P9_ESCWE|nr:Exostosin-2 [Escovopsis weberi]
MVAQYITGLKTVFVRRIATILLSACVAATLIVLLVEIDPAPLPDLSRIPASISSALGGEQVPVAERCSPRNYTSEVSDRWAAAQQRYSNLTDDKFTIAIQAYKQPKELDDVLRILLSDRIPSLYEVVVVWNDLEEEPPGNFKSEHGVLVRYRTSPVNSRNQKYVPDADFKTQAILLSDADVYYKPGDLEFVFQTWRSFGQQRLTGALARCASPNDDGRWEYSTCSNDKDQGVYSMVVTNLCFSQLSFLDFYSSDDPVMAKVRKYVDDHKGCESIAMNYLASYLTGHGPLLVRGRDKFVDMSAQEAAADAKPSSVEMRSRCLNDLSAIFGCMPLINETGHIQRGLGRRR